MNQSFTKRLSSDVASYPSFFSGDALHFCAGDWVRSHRSASADPAAAATRTIPAAMNICPIDQFQPIISPPMMGPKIAPRRPKPIAAPMLVPRQPDRESVVEGKHVSVSVDLGGRRIFKKKKNMI